MPNVLRCILAGLALATVTGCATAGPSADAPRFEATGVYVRHLRVRVAPDQKRPFETLMRRLATAATLAELPEESAWLCYREPPDHYWILFFSDEAAGFATPPTLAGIVEALGRAAGESALGELRTLEARLRYESEWEIVLQQKSSWSTVEEMSTATHPKARMIEYTLRTGHERSFDAALSAWTAFLTSHGFPVPVEGFTPRSGPQDIALQVVFPVDWGSYRESATFSAFAATLDEASRRTLAEREAAWTATVSRVTRYDGDFVPELSFDP